MDFPRLRRYESTLETAKSYSLLECACQYGTLFFCPAFSSRTEEEGQKGDPGASSRHAEEHSPAPCRSHSNEDSA